MYCGGVEVFNIWGFWLGREISDEKLGGSSEKNKRVSSERDIVPRMS